MPDAKTRFIITDPCYLIDDDAHPDAWSHFCELSDSRSNWEVTQQANEYLSGELGFGIVAASTGFGDWSNCIEGEGVVNMNFFADAGMVCVAEIPKSALVQEGSKTSRPWAALQSLKPTAHSLIFASRWLARSANGRSCGFTALTETSSSILWKTRTT